MIESKSTISFTDKAQFSVNLTLNWRILIFYTLGTNGLSMCGGQLAYAVSAKTGADSACLPACPASVMTSI